ncbi:MAG TPA: S9 family peptidase [Bryobacteraceae bacterium]|nr:S9 family peptidase [Bryobacteraceae bacterium]
MRIAAALLLTALTLAAQKKPVTIDAVVNAPDSSRAAITWAQDGEHFIVNERGELSLYDVRTSKERRIISLSDLHAAAIPSPPPSVFDWTNRRVGEHDVQWFADGKRLLVANSGDLFIVDIAKGHFDALTQTSEAERDPKLSPDNQYVSFRRGPDLYTIEIASKIVTRLTTTGTGTLLNGEADWVYPEELDLDTAHWWSPDSGSIAYLQFDTAREPVFPQVSLLNTRGVLEPERYPKAGDPNADVRLGIVPTTGGQTKWMDLGDPRASLLARVVWAPDSRTILAERLNRVQNKLDLLLADASTGASHTVLHEEDPQWINVKSGPRFLGSGNEFLWTSERSGFRHLYLYKLDQVGQGVSRANDGPAQLEKQLTTGPWQVDDLVGVDEKTRRVLYTSTEDSPTERQFYSINLDGTNKQRLTKGEGTHTIALAPNAAYYLDDYSSLKAPLTRTLYKSDGTAPRQFRAADRGEFNILPTEIVQLKAVDGTTLYARMIKPAGFQPTKKYPAIVIVYGGPGAQYALNHWTGLTWDQALAQQGFVIWQLDNRGSTGRGHVFESAIYHNMGAHELADQKDGIDYLIKQGFVDPAHIGVYGWSYGGFMTLYTITHAPGLIKAAIAGAPVTNWRNYDSIYTERYMGLPEENEKGYTESAVTRSADGLEGTKLLMIHNIEDDNVHFQNSMQMAEALQKAGKQFYMMVYPQKTHHVSGPEYKQLLEEETSFFEENLK